MSMLSSQVEEMRDAAATYRMLGRDVLANVLYEAAESITELRDHLQHANAENTKLRELVQDMWNDFNHDCRCSWEGSCKNPLCKYNGECSYENRMYELGIEIP